MRLRTAIGLAALLRAGLLLWGTYQDAHSQVPYTDVDYFVFSDAAACILRPTRQFCGQAKGPIAPTWLGDPYSRATYRYTPLVALLLVPNEWAHPAFGKILFCCADLLVGVLLYRLLIGKKTAATRSTNAVAAIWLLNPIIANISTRGSSESVVGAIVVTTLSLAERDRWDAAALVFGLAVHVKIFPFMYGSSLIATLVSRARNRRTAVVSLLRFGALSFAAFMALNTICYLVCVSSTSPVCVSRDKLVSLAVSASSLALAPSNPAASASRSSKRPFSTISRASTIGTTFRRTSTPFISRPPRPLSRSRPPVSSSPSQGIPWPPFSLSWVSRLVSASRTVLEISRSLGWSRHLLS